MKNKKRKGVFTIEAVLLIPILLLIFILIVDMIYLSYVKTSAKSKIELSVLDLKNKMPEVRNEDFNNMKASPPTIKDYTNNKLKRTIFDEMNFFIDKNTFVKGACLELKHSMQNKKVWKNDINISKDLALINYNYNIAYKLEFRSFLSNIYQKYNLKVNRIKGSCKFKEHRIFDEIVSIDTAYSFIEDSKIGTKIASEFKKALGKIKK